MSSDLKGRKAKRTVGFRFAWNGVVEVCKSEKNFRIHLCIASFVILAGVLLHLSVQEWLVIITIISVILSLEMVNTGVEKLLDYLAPEFHPLVGVVKDITAGAVLVSSIGSVFIGIIIFWPKILSLL